MNNKVLQLFAILLFCLAGLTFPRAVAYATPNLLFDKTSVSVVQNTTFSVTININVDTNSVRSSDVALLYASSDFDVTQVTGGRFFPSFTSANDTSAGRLELHGYTAYVGDSRTGTDTFATITFKAKKGSGSSTISFICSGSGQDTNILTTAGQNILTCTQVNQLGVSYSDGSSPTPTPTPTLAPGETPTPTPTPTNPNTIPTCQTLASDTSLAVGAPLSVTFTCSGIDPDGYINAAEFTFGDGVTDTVYKNAGSPGAITTTHTYTTIGTLGASCRIRDNNNVFSNSTNDCKRIIVINPRPQNAAATSYYTRVIAAESTAVNPTIAVSPTPEQVAIVYTTPAPTVTSPTPTPQVASTKISLGNLLWYIGGGLAAILAAILLFRKKGPPPTLPPTYMQQPPTPPPSPPSA